MQYDLLRSSSPAYCMQKLNLRGSPEIPRLMSQAESADYGKAVPEARELRILRRGFSSSIEVRQH